MRRAIPLLVLGMLGYALLQGFPFRESPNSQVIANVTDHYDTSRWMKHITGWNTSLGISVQTDYPHDDVDSYGPAFEICEAVKMEFKAIGADVPNLRVYGTAPKATQLAGTGSKSVGFRVLAAATNVRDYACGIDPADDVRDDAKTLGLPMMRQ